MRTLPSKTPLNPPNRLTKHGRSPGPPYVRHATASPFTPATDVNVPHSWTVKPTWSAAFGRAIVTTRKSRRTATIDRTTFRLINVSLPRLLLHNCFVDECGKRFDFILLQVQVRHLGRFDAGIGEKFLEVVLLEPLACEIELRIGLVLRIDLQMTVTTDATFSSEQPQSSGGR